MLRFEETNGTQAPAAPTAATLPFLAGDGYVVLPINDYNELLRRADAAYNAVRISRISYMDTKPIEASIDKYWLYDLLMCKLSDTYTEQDLADYAYKQSAEELYVPDITLAERLPVPTEEVD